jgi:metal-dependent amidase/aminoacylase/carboxypeptidase family protein
MRIIAEGTPLTCNVATEVTYTREFVPAVNDSALVDKAFAAAQEPMTGSDDFARFLKHMPGCFAFVGDGKDSALLHNPSYDFIDEGLVHEARFHAGVTQQRLPSI